MTAGKDMENGLASSLTDAGCSISRSTSLRRVGSASAWNTSSRPDGRLSIWLTVPGLDQIVKQLTNYRRLDARWRPGPGRFSPFPHLIVRRRDGNGPEGPWTPGYSWMPKCQVRKNAGGDRSRSGMVVVRAPPRNRITERRFRMFEPQLPAIPPAY